jgi:hypothetical protein
VADKTLRVISGANMAELRSEWVYDNEGKLTSVTDPDFVFAWQEVGSAFPLS